MDAHSTAGSVKLGWGVGEEGTGRCPQGDMEEAGRTAESPPQVAALVLSERRRLWLQGVKGSYSFPGRIVLRVQGGILRKEFFLRGGKRKI